MVSSPVLCVSCGLLGGAMPGKCDLASTALFLFSGLI